MIVQMNKNSRNIKLLLVILLLIFLAYNKGMSNFLRIFLIFSSIISMKSLFEFLFKDKNKSLLVLVTLLLVLSFCTVFFQKTIIYGLSVIGLYIIIRNMDIKKIFHCFEMDWITLIDIVSYILIVIFLSIIYCENQDGWFLYDYFHPFYELSSSQSYSLSSLMNIRNISDLAYSGKNIAISFLSLKIPVLVSNVLRVNIINSLYFFTPLSIIILFSISLRNFYENFKYLRTPIIIIYFYCFGMGAYDSFFMRTVVGASSFGIGYILFFIYLSLSDKKYEKYRLFSMILLFLVRFNYSLVLLGAEILLLIKKRNVKDFCKRFIKTFLCMLVCYPFVKGFHPYLNWIYGGLIFDYIKTFDYNLIFILLPLVFTVYTLCKSKNKNLQYFASISISGFIGTLLIGERAEYLSNLFIISVYPLFVIIMYSSIKRMNIKKSLSLIKFIILYGVIINAWKIKSFNDLMIIGLIINLLLIMYLVINHLKYDKSLLKKIILYQLIFLSFSMFKYNSFNLIYSRYLKSNTVYDKSVIDSYLWLSKNSGKNSVVLFNPLYQNLVNNFADFPQTSFLRSGLSGRQMVLENFKYRGIHMENDFATRYSKIIRFYELSTDQSEKSRKLLDTVKNIPSNLKKSLEDKSKPWSSFNLEVYKRQIIKKDYTYENYGNKVLLSIPNEYKKISESKDFDLNSFLREYNISYVVLENGDKPNYKLMELFKKVYETKDTIILKKIE